ncbi:MAG: recombination protein RecR [Xanthomonadales bacterium]|nr:recombination protein RecR [Xanthomonadales bacterium]MCB1629028.1 recombination protein RecR [Xanthomonadales bacterium]MCB1634751.1 recombination protein RecR [Xanthomonadales bacterium]
MSASLEQLIEALRALPGVGRKTAQRMAFQLLAGQRREARTLAQALTRAVEQVRRCRECRNYADSDLCAICANERRQQQTLCVVETPADLLALEQATGYSGRYFVLHGRLSPLDGIGPEELGLAQLADRLAEQPVQELILAINPSVEGEATAHLLAGMAQSAGIRVSRLAHGIPVGGELEYTDRHTLAHAFGGRQTVAP